jgi:mono/diheme cytochrome c family protein
MKSFRERNTAGVVVLAIALFFSPVRVQVVAAAQESKSPDTLAGNAEKGKLIYTKDGCYQCHGREGQGSNMAGPRIAPNPVPLEVLISYVRKPTGEMPPYTAKVISDQELADIYAYLQSRPHPPTAKAAPLLK